MKKKLKHEEDKEKTEPKSSTTTGTEPVNVGESTGTEIKPVAEVKKINKLSVGFPNEDMNQVVAKLNELIDKVND